ncbi:MAG: C2H2-type zinc finger protein [Nitrosopumilaceae archaeon]|nr:C2H2-type zinc finger protein [Nitrosopumilaceae archaeon]
MLFFKKFKCDVCNRKFSQQEELMQHQQTTHYKDYPYDCKKCNKNFSSMEDMRSHLQKEHSYKKDRN